MIAEMKKVTVVASQKRKEELLVALRDEGIMHVSGIVQHSTESEGIDKDLSSYAEVISAIRENQNKKQKKADVLLSDEEFKERHQRFASLLEERKSLTEDRSKAMSAISDIAAWGDFDPEEVKALGKDGITLTFYTMGKKEFEQLSGIDGVTYVRLKDINKQPCIATVGKKLDSAFPAEEFILPEKSLSMYQKDIEDDEGRIAEIDKELKEGSVYLKSYSMMISRLTEEKTFSLVKASAMDEGGDVCLLQGYIPTAALPQFKKRAAKEAWAYLIDDVTDDDNPPTEIVYNKVSKVAKPVFDLLGTVPGYREYDISFYFLLFFSLFFAMIIGDGGYGLLFLIGAIALHRKQKKASDLVMLLYVVSITTVIWGAVTGTWFGSETIIRDVKILQLPVIPTFANYPQDIQKCIDAGITGTDTQNQLMKFSFMLGVIQLSLGSIMNIIKKSRTKDLSLFADCGWLMESIVLYSLVLNLVVGEKGLPLALIGGVVATGFFLVVIFGQQAPGTPFVKGLLSGLGGFFTTFLDTISAFSNLMSYIRLFAVGMASLAIAQSFNAMAAPMLKGLAFPAGVVIILIGHGLNIIMGLLSVVVHGVRLNLMEFSGRLGMEWAGYQYDPFRRTAKEKVVGNN